MEKKLKYRRLYVLSQGVRKYSFSIPLKDSIRIGDRDFPLVPGSDERHGTFILWRNRKYPVEIIRSRQNRYEILFNDVSYTFTVETPFSIRRRNYLSSGAAGNSIELIRAPMPGKIVDIPARENSNISRGEALIILEAMKMQNEIQSPVDGKVKRILTRPDSTVMKGDILAEIEPLTKKEAP